MKTLINLLFISVFFSTPLFALDSCLSGSWYNPDNPGSGIDVQVLENQTVAYYFAYGSAGQAWYVMLGEDQNLRMISTSRQGNDVSEFDVGSARIEPIDNNTISFSYDIIIDASTRSWCLSWFCSDELIYKRLTTPIPCD